MPSIPYITDTTYEIVGEIGSGGGGVIYKAWHTRLQKHVVIKELRSSMAGNVAAQRNEIEALKNVKSPFLPQVFDFLVESSRTFTVMEFIEGESFDKLLERGVVFSQPQVIKWYEQLTSAIEIIHKRNIFHRDIKPANIMLTPTGDVCLIDFNAALVSGNDVRLISRSLGYASPEQYDIFERYRHNVNMPIKLDSYGYDIQPQKTPKVKNTYGNNTNVLFNTEYSSSENNEAKSESVTSEMHTPIITEAVDWKRSDIYSLGATMYHLLTGLRPPNRAAEVIPLSRTGRFSEGVVFIVERSIRLYPYERFSSVSELAETIRNIHKYDKKWKVSRVKGIVAMTLLPVLFVLFATMAFRGKGVMDQERIEQFYELVYSISNTHDAQIAFERATSMYWERIEPFHAMAKRLWNDGDIDACRDFIESNIGNLAKFQSMQETHDSLGEIYNILGNCYYYQTGNTDYVKALGAFEVAVHFVRGNPVFYRDYAIALARTGDIPEAEQILERARLLDLESDSLDFLRGEIAYAKRDYQDALEHFDKVIMFSDKDYLRYRAYHVSDDIFKLLGEPERSVNLLSGALSRIPVSRVPEMKLRLANAYALSGDYENTVILLEELLDGMGPQLQTMQNLVVILIQEKRDYNRAALLLDKMDEQFPNDYNVPMYRAYLEEARQRLLPNEERDYTLMKNYYDIAVSLYRDNFRPGESDPKMQQLELLIDQLRAGGWLDN